MIPRIKLVEIYFSEYPDYIEATKAYYANPSFENMMKREHEFEKTTFPPGEYPDHLDSLYQEENFLSE